MKSSTTPMAKFVLACAATVPLTVLAQTVEVSPAVQHDHLPSLRGVMPKPDEFSEDKKHVREVKYIPHLNAPGNAVDTSVQGSPSQSPAAVTSSGLGFAGVGNGDYGFAPDAAPPDTNGAVGLTQFVQWVNEDFAVYDKVTGTRLYGRAA